MRWHIERIKRNYAIEKLELLLEVDNAWLVKQSCRNAFGRIWDIYCS
jgi:hypothetical protein